MGNSGDAEIGRARVPPRLTGKDLLGRWLARRLALPIFSHLPSQGGFSQELPMPPWGRRHQDENAYSPPSEGRRGGLSRTGGPTPKATPSAPPQRRFSEECLD